MKILRKPLEVPAKVLGKNPLKVGQRCRMNTFCILAEHPDGMLINNQLNGAVALLDSEEEQVLYSLPGVYQPEMEPLAALWFIVPEEQDDIALCDSTKTILAAMDCKKKPITAYTIYTTTDCNARCFYCFEMGAKRVHMTSQTAHDLADYIQAHCGGHSVSLKWFGGEPLVNERAIDIICADLQEKGISFSSRMVSNSYLFTPELIEKARTLWNLKHVQITLDGTEKVYNRRKAYIHPQGSPYQRVLHNIEELRQAGIRILIRINTDFDNLEDVRVLCEELNSLFYNRKNIRIYVAPIFGNTDSQNSPDYECQQQKLSVAIDKLSSQAGLYRYYSKSCLPYCITFYQCMADSPTSTTVLPDGSLGRCEHYTESEFWGSIYSEERDETILQSWKRVQPAQPQCKKCPIYPNCVHIEKCPGNKRGCTLQYQEKQIQKRVLQLKNTYEYMLSKQPAPQDQPEELPDC